MFNLFPAAAHEGNDECVRAKSMEALMHGVAIEPRQINCEEHHAPYAVIGEREQRLQRGVPGVVNGDSEPNGLERSPNHSGQRHVGFDEHDVRNSCRRVRVAPIPTALHR